MSRFTTRAAAAIAVAALTTLVSSANASAHVTPVQPSAPADGYTTVELQVPHGCDGQATDVVSVQLPDDLTSVKAQAVPGWSVEYERQPLDTPVEVHGEPVTEYVAVVSWTAEDEPLPDDQFMRFGISMRTPASEGETMLLPTVQTCVDGSEAAWIDEDPESDHPAPAVELVASAGGHGTVDAAYGDDGGSQEGDGTDAPASTDPVAAERTAASDDPSSDGVARGLGVGAIVLAAGALVVGLRRRD